MGSGERVVQVIQKKVCLMGNFAVGKTSLVRQYVEGRFDERYLSTIGVKISRKVIEIDGRQIRLLIWDLAGGDEFMVYQSSYLRGAAGALIVCDLTRQDTLDSLPGYVRQLRQVNPDPALIFLGNKVDLKELHQVTDEAFRESSQSLGFPYLLTSAKTGEQVELAFHKLVEAIGLLA